MGFGVVCAALRRVNSLRCDLKLSFNLPYQSTSELLLRANYYRSKFENGEK